MAERIINIGIVGLGRIAATFAEALLGTAGARLAAVCSRDMAKARAFAAGSGGPKPFDNLAAMLESSAIDVLYVASPNTLHRAHALAAIAAGKGVLVEKPFAASADEAREIADAARQAGVFCMEALWTRFVPAVREAKALIASGALGEVRSFQGDLAYAQGYHPNSRFFNPALGGGALLDLGVYPLSLALHLMGPPTFWTAAGCLAPTGVEMRASAALSYPQGAASFTCGFDAEGANGAVIVGEKARLTLHRPLNAPALLTLAPQPAPRPPRSGPSTQIPGGASAGTRPALKTALRALNPLKKRAIYRPYRGNGMGHQIDEVVRCLRAGLSESEIMPLADSIRQLEIIDDLSRLVRTSGG